MELNTYQEKAMTTCMETSNNVVYMAGNLSGEVGEFWSKLVKAQRKGAISIDSNPHVDNGIIEGVVENYKDCDNDALMEKRMLYLNSLNEELKLEAGDVLWQLSGLCSVMGWKLEDIAQMNLDKLASRANRGVIDGNGDNR